MEVQLTKQIPGLFEDDLGQFHRHPTTAGFFGYRQMGGFRSKIIPHKNARKNATSWQFCWWPFQSLLVTSKGIKRPLYGLPGIPKDPDPNRDSTAGQTNERL